MQQATKTGYLGTSTTHDVFVLSGTLSKLKATIRPLIYPRSSVQISYICTGKKSYKNKLTSTSIWSPMRTKRAWEIVEIVNHFPSWWTWSLSTSSCSIMMYPDPSAWGLSPSTRLGRSCTKRVVVEPHLQQSLFTKLIQEAIFF